MRFPTLSTVPIGIMFAGQALANPITCSHGDLSRKIEVVYSDPGQPVPCEVIYDKSAEGTIETLWRANNEAGYCEAQAKVLVEKLIDMGWQCSEEAPADPGEATEG